MPTEQRGGRRRCGFRNGFAASPRGDAVGVNTTAAPRGPVTYAPEAAAPRCRRRRGTGGGPAASPKLERRSSRAMNIARRHGSDPVAHQRRRADLPVIIGERRKTPSVDWVLSPPAGSHFFWYFFQSDALRSATVAGVTMGRHELYPGERRCPGCATTGNGAVLGLQHRRRRYLPTSSAGTGRRSRSPSPPPQRLVVNKGRFVSAPNGLLVRWDDRESARSAGRPS